MSGSLFPTPNESVLPQRALRCKIMVKGKFSIHISYTFIIYALPPFVSLGSVRFYVFKRSLTKAAFI